MKIDPTLTEIEDKHERCGVEYWEKRVAAVGNHRSPFLDKPQEEIDVFTNRHRELVKFWTLGKGVLEIGCGYGRNMDMFRGSKWYAGMECCHSLIEEARVNFTRVFPGKGLGVFHGDLQTFDFTGYENDICVAIAVISSVEPFFHDLRKRILDILNPEGIILWLEEDYTRIDYKQ